MFTLQAESRRGESWIEEGERVKPAVAHFRVKVASDPNERLVRVYHQGVTCSCDALGNNPGGCVHAEILRRGGLILKARSRARSIRIEGRVS